VGKTTSLDKGGLSEKIRKKKRGKDELGFRGWMNLGEIRWTLVVSESKRSWKINGKGVPNWENIIRKGGGRQGGVANSRNPPWEKETFFLE